MPLRKIYTNNFPALATYTIAANSTWQLNAVYVAITQSATNAVAFANITCALFDGATQIAQFEYANATAVVNTISYLVLAQLSNIDYPCANGNLTIQFSAGNVSAVSFLSSIVWTDFSV